MYIAHIQRLPVTPFANIHRFIVSVSYQVQPVCSNRTALPKFHLCLPPSVHGRKPTRRVFCRFLKTPAGTKFLLTLPALVTDRALSVCDRTPYEHGLTGDMSFLLGAIERLAVEGEPEETGGLRSED